MAGCVAEMNDPGSHKASVLTTLAVDIGGTHLKAGILDGDGMIVAGPNRVDTPHPSGPDVLIASLLQLIAPLGQFSRVSVGFPGVVRGGHTLTAPNLGTELWQNFPLADELGKLLDRPVRVLNDASIQGLGVIADEGLECVITLGTGFGFALFQDGKLAPHLEVGQHPITKGKTYDLFIGNAALHKIGKKRWNKRLQTVISVIDTMVTYDSLIIGGGNAQAISFELPANVRIVPNSAGITGGVKLWSSRLDDSYFNRATRLRRAPEGIVSAPEVPA